MNFAVLFLSIASLALAAPAIADARPDGKGQRAEQRERVRGDEGRPGRDMRNRPPRETRPPDYRPRDYRPRGDSLGSGYRQQQNEAWGGVRWGGLRPLKEVLPNVHRRFPGRQLDAGLEQGWQGQPVYRVRWATDRGRRIDVIVDAQTGAILEVEGQ